jgi:type IV fimbrial biogenesis protein FimT
MGVPSLRAFMTNNELTSRSNNLVAAIQFARSESIKRGARIVICPSITATAAIPGCSGSNDWLPGMIIFYDDDNSGSFNPGDELIKQYTNNVGATPFISINAEVLHKDDPVTISTYLSFVSPRGEPQLTDGTNQSGIFKVCNLNDTSRVQGVMIHPSGRIYSSHDSATLGAHITCP